MVNPAIRKKLKDLAPDDKVRACLDEILVFELDQDGGGFQYKKQYLALVDKHLETREGEDLED
jgi:hypothetical protein